MTIKTSIELVKEGFANGVAEGGPLLPHKKQQMIVDAADAFGKFLDALKCDWRNDPNSDNTPMRVAKAYVRRHSINQYVFTSSSDNNG